MTLAEHAAIGVLEGVAIAAEVMTDEPDLKPSSPMFRALAREARRAIFDLRGAAVSRLPESPVALDHYADPVNAALAVLKKACALYDGAISPMAAGFSLAATARRLEAIARDFGGPPTLRLELRVHAARLRSQADIYNQPPDTVARATAEETPLAAVTRLMAEVTTIGARAALAP